MFSEFRSHFKKCKGRKLLQNRKAQKSENNEKNSCNKYHDVTTGTVKGREYKEPHHNIQIVYHIEKEKDADRNHMVDRRLFKPISGNVTK